MKVMIIGSGGREHALGWKMAQSPYVSGVVYVGGNAGTLKEEKSLGNFEAITYDDIYRIVVEHKIDLVIPGSESMFVSGIVDYLFAKGYTNIFGPTKAAARLESDKFFSFDIMADLIVPQASGIKCYNKSELREIIEHFSADSRLVVLKARGLTGGKGVLVCDSKEHALESVDPFTDTYGSEVLVSERLYGEEFSVFAVCDGENVTPFPFIIKDYKRLCEGNKGPNTGGMGSHTTHLDYPNLVNTVAKDITTPVIRKMKEIGCEYKGFLYAGMILTTTKGLKVLEFNCRFGDPECQVAMLSLESDLFQVIQDTLVGKVPEIRQKPGETCNVVLASRDYPASELRLGEFLHILPTDESIKIFHAGTRYEKGNIRVSGGRILNVASYADDLPTARKNVYRQILKIVDQNSYTFNWRGDIALKDNRKN